MSDSFQVHFHPKLGVVIYDPLAQMGLAREQMRLFKVGSMTASTIAMLGKVGDHAPHGGPIVLPVIDNKIMYIIAIAAGTIVTAVAIIGLKMITGGGQKATGNGE